MLTACWSVKGGSGTTVVAVATALHLARSLAEPVVLADLAGEVPAVLGIPEPAGPGLSEHLTTAAAPDRLLAAAVPAADGLLVLHRGPAPLPADPAAGDDLAAALASAGAVVADCGLPSPGSVAWAVAAGADHSLLVIRPCYLALRRALDAPLRPSGVVLVTEPGRALGRTDVEAVLGVPVCSEVPWEPGIARAVDAGLLAARLPRALDRAVRPAAA